MIILNLDELKVEGDMELWLTQNYADCEFVIYGDEVYLYPIKEKALSKFGTPYRINKFRKKLK